METILAIMSLIKDKTENDVKDLIKNTQLVLQLLNSINDKSSTTEKNNILSIIEEKVQFIADPLEKESARIFYTDSFIKNFLKKEFIIVYENIYKQLTFDESISTIKDLIASVKINQKDKEILDFIRRKIHTNLSFTSDMNENTHIFDTFFQNISRKYKDIDTNIIKFIIPLLEKGLDEASEKLSEQLTFLENKELQSIIDENHNIKMPNLELESLPLIPHKYTNDSEITSFLNIIKKAIKESHSKNSFTTNISNFRLTDEENKINNKLFEIQSSMKDENI